MMEGVEEYNRINPNIQAPNTRQITMNKLQITNKHKSRLQRKNMTLYQDKYRIESTRLKYWDYTANGYYSVTICIQNRKCLFGNVVDGKMQLSPFGEIAMQSWRQIPSHFPNVRLDLFVIMPNHVHGILFICRKTGNGFNDNDPIVPIVPIVPVVRVVPVVRIVPVVRVETCHGMSLQNHIQQPTYHQQQPTYQQQPCEQNNADKYYIKQKPKLNTFSKPIAGSLSIIINHYKGALMRWCKNNGYAHFQWQPRFYDRIIRDEMELNRTRKYIIDNPAKWKKDPDVIGAGRNNVFI